MTPRVALIAHDMKKDDIVALAGEFAATLAEAHKEGLSVVVWTVNEESAINALAESGVDGIISDYPDRARRALARRGLTLSAASRIRR